VLQMVRASLAASSCEGTARDRQLAMLDLEAVVSGLSCVEEVASHPPPTRGKGVPPQSSAPRRSLRARVVSPPAAGTDVC
jgi:hypothetical protein